MMEKDEVSVHSRKDRAEAREDRGPCTHPPFALALHIHNTACGAAFLMLAGVKK